VIGGVKRIIMLLRVKNDNAGAVVDNVEPQLILTRLRGGPIGGICCVARARNASFIKWGCVVTIFFQPTVSITSVAWLLQRKK
jgi:hypothetical protein